MTIHHHISDETLLSYAAGDLDDAVSLLVASHLTLCPECRRRAAVAEDIGGSMLGELEPVRMSDDALAHVLALTERVERDPELPVPAETRNDYVFPAPLRQRLGGDLKHVKWQRIGYGIHQYVLNNEDGASQARLLRIAGGQGVLEHGHSGEEYTLVLSGGFSDGEQSFARGDVEWANDDVIHRPVADAGESCVCLAVTTGPLRFSNIIGRIAQPFLNI